MSNSVLSEIILPASPLEDQARVVLMPKRFEGMVTDLSVSLPWGIDARGKQYAHFTEKLLTFEECVA